MEKIVLTAVGYEGEERTYIVKGKNLAECYMKVYLDLHSYDEEDLEDDEKYQDEDYWLDELENEDPADFVLLTVYSITKDEVLYEDPSANTYEL